MRRRWLSAWPPCAGCPTTSPKRWRPSPTRSPQRLKLRTTADRVLAAIHSIPKPDHPDYYFVSTAWDKRVSGNRNSYPPDDEQNLPGFPWWMMSRKYGFPDTG